MTAFSTPGTRVPPQLCPGGNPDGRNAGGPLTSQNHNIFAESWHEIEIILTSSHADGPANRFSAPIVEVIILRSSSLSDKQQIFESEDRVGVGNPVQIYGFKQLQGRIEVVHVRIQIGSLVYKTCGPMISDVLSGSKFYGSHYTQTGAQAYRKHSINLIHRYSSSYGDVTH